LLAALSEYFLDPEHPTRRRPRTERISHVSGPGLVET
jgi:hypothetical protein